jgi:hypothetical protein
VTWLRDSDPRARERGLQPVGQSPERTGDPALDAAGTSSPAKAIRFGVQVGEPLLDGLFHQQRVEGHGSAPY